MDALENSSRTAFQGVSDSLSPLSILSIFSPFCLIHFKPIQTIAYLEVNLKKTRLGVFLFTLARVVPAIRADLATMALSLSNFLTPILALLFLALSARAATVTYDFDIAWTTANPDRAFERSVIGINGQWPPPIMHANKGDTVVVHAHNGLKNVTTSLHFHGIFQNGTTHMDGAAGVTQCPIAPGSSITYNFTV